MTRRMFAGLLSVPVTASSAFAAETAKERGKRLVDKVIEGLGGDAFRNMRTRTEIGRASTFYREKLTGYSPARIYTKYLESVVSGQTTRAGILELQRQVFGKKQEDAVIFTTERSFRRHLPGRETACRRQSQTVS